MSLRSIIIGIIGAIVITTSSMYVALKMGALPWPTVFVAIVSMSILKILKKTNLNEINITHTMMSAGAMVSGGLAFTIPGIWIIKPDYTIDIFSLFILTISGAILGTILTFLVRKYFIEEEKLPYPMGIASSNILKIGDEGGKKGIILLISIIITAIFTWIRDSYNIIPQAFNSKILSKYNINFGFWLSPMAVGIGYLIGPLFTGVWFIASFLTYFIFTPISLYFNFFNDINQAFAFKNSLGIGVMVGTGIAILIKSILPSMKKIFSNVFKTKYFLKIIPVVFATIVFVLTIYTKMTILSSILAIIGVFITTLMAASITGQTGINPMEIFGIIVLIFIRIFLKISTIEAFYIVGLVAISTGVCGDVLNDFKSGYILKTDPKKQLIAELIGSLVGAIVSVLIMVVMLKAFKTVGPGTELVAPQAYAVSTMVSSIPYFNAFIIGSLIGFILYILNVPAMTLGLGIYLPMFISTTAFLGGLIKLLVDKIKPEFDDNFQIISSALLGGEGITGVVIAIIKVITMN